MAHSRYQKIKYRHKTGGSEVSTEGESETSLVLEISHETIGTMDLAKEMEIICNSLWQLDC